MDLSSYWALYNRHKSRGGQLFFVLVALIIGWQIGRTTSPYYDARPIVFEDTTCEGGSPEELSKLQEEGKEQRSQELQAQVKKEEKNTQSATPTTAVAGTTDDKATAGRFVGSVNSNLFHDPSCSSSKRIKDTNQIWFESVEDAQQSGYSASKCTKKILGI